MDIQLIRSPYFETKYLPQSEEHLVFDEVEATFKETKQPTVWKEEALLKDFDRIEELFAKLERVDTICSALGDEAQRSPGSAGNAVGDLGGLEIGHFTADTEAQTDDCLGIELKEALNLVEMAKEADLEMHKLTKEAIRLVMMEHEEKWTQTDWNTETETTSNKTKSLAEKIARLWMGSKGKRTKSEEK